MTPIKEFKKGEQPHFCIIAPTAYLPRYAIMSPKHLVLAHLVDTDDEYANFYKTRSEMYGDAIIMDNGAFELGESYDPMKLIDLGMKCGADMIVLPDYPFVDAQRTIRAAVEWAPTIKAAGFKTMFVPQAPIGDLDGFIVGYNFASCNSHIDAIGMSILNIPNALPHVPAAYSRVVMTQVLMDREILADKYHHYLGLNAGPALEIPSLIKMGALDSCDSSGPVWAGILGHEYSYNTDSYQIVKKIKAHVQFDYPLATDKETHRRIQRNIEMTLELFEGE